MGVFTLTLVRHGETQANHDRIIQGQQDTVLSNQGLEQAKLTGIRLQQESFTHSFCSDLKRASKTCELILDKNSSSSSCAFVTDSRLRERKFGTFEGCASAEFQQAARKHRKSSASGEEFPPGGETVKQLRARAIEFFQDLCQKFLTLEAENLAGTVKRRRHTGSGCSDVFPVPETTTSDTGINFTVKDNDNSLNLSTGKDSGHSSSGSTSSTSGCESAATYSSLDLHSGTITPTEPHHIALEYTSDISPSQESSTSSIDDSPSDGGVILTACDCDIQRTVKPAKMFQFGCPNVSLSPVFEHRLSSMSSVSSGRNNSFDEADLLPVILADVLIVGHGGWIQQLITVFVDEFGCKIPGGKKYALQISPNTGLSKFAITLEPGQDRPGITCLYVHDKDHLASLELEALQHREDS